MQRKKRTVSLDFAVRQTKMHGKLMSLPCVKRKHTTKNFFGNCVRDIEGPMKKNFAMRKEKAHDKE
jgi:hypothetical protein